MNWWWLLVPAGYALGTFPTAHIVGKLTGHDPTAEGSGNPGASNVYRVAGARAGVVVLVVDLIKGLAPTAIGLAADGRPLGVAAGVAAVAGHIVPVWRLASGGKGVATFGGANIALNPIVSVACILVWAATMKLSRTASIASLAMVVALPLGVAVRGRPWWEIAALALTALVIVARHRHNIVRIWRREERSIR